MSSRRIIYNCRKSLTRTVCCDTELSAELQKALWQGDVDRLLFASEPLQEKDRCIVALCEDAGLPLVVKRHTWGGLWRTLRMAWREPSARRCARLGRHLSDHGIPTPRPRAWVEERLGPMGYRSYLFTDFIEGTSLYRFIRSGKWDANTLEHLATQVAGIWQRIVELGVRHGDLKPENFIVDPDLRVWILDLERTRLGGRAKRHGARQLADLDVFLHIRGWHRQLEAREVFRCALARTDAGQRLGMPALEHSKSAAAARAAEVDAGLRVLILRDDAEHDGANAEQAVESVRDIADEVVIGTCRGVSSQFECTSQRQLCDRDGGDCEWLLVLHQNERVTPVLAKRLQEAITRPIGPHAFRIAIERQFFGRNIAVASAAAGSIRLFRPDSCSYAVANGELTIAVDPEQTGELEGTIQQSVVSSVSEFVTFLDRQSTRAAGQRWQAGERPRWIAALAGSITTFIKRCIGPGGIRSGWAGIHATTLETVFRWIEEVKLWQMSGQFHNSRGAISGEDVDLALPRLDARRRPKPSSELPLNKAA